jgi:hypothetical protein
MYKLGYEILTVIVTSSSIFWHMTLAAYFMPVSSLAYS